MGLNNTMDGFTQVFMSSTYGEWLNSDSNYYAVIFLIFRLTNQREIHVSPVRSKRIQLLSGLAEASSSKGGHKTNRKL
jgi:hypothetical protein